MKLGVVFFIHFVNGTPVLINILADSLFFLSSNLLGCNFAAARGVDDPALWAGKVGNSWRTTDDINDTWARLDSGPLRIIALLFHGKCEKVESSLFTDLKSSVFFLSQSSEVIYSFAW